MPQRPSHEEILRRIKQLHGERIRKAGMSGTTTISPFHPTWMSYTIGLSVERGFELINFGLESNVAGTIFHAIRKLLIDDTVLELNTQYDFGFGLHVMFKKCDPLIHPELWDQCMCHAELILQAQPDVWQMIFADDEGRWPFDPMCDPKVVRLQHLLY